MSVKQQELNSQWLSEQNIDQNPLALYRQSFHPSLGAVFNQLSQVNAQKTFLESKSASVNESFNCLEDALIHFCLSSQEKVSSALKVGVMLSGGPAPGGHNVIAALLDGLLKLHPQSELVGFHCGAQGLLEDEWSLLTLDSIKSFRNMGGFDLLGSGRVKIESPEQFEAARNSVAKLELDGLVIIGGDDSNTNAALLAQDFASHKIPCTVVGVPKTIDGDMKGEGVELSFGFDTACRVYSEMIGNLARDCISSRKYYHFVRLMGRSASHITLECALQTRPTIALIGEEIKRERKTLCQIVEEISQVITQRYKRGMSYGVVLVPEGLVEFIPQFSTLIEELNEILAQYSHITVSEVEAKLVQSKELFEKLPLEVKKQLLLERDPHGNVQVSRIEIEKILMEMVEARLKEQRVDVSCLGHFLGYEARAAMPTDFDATYTYALGLVATLLIREKASGYLAFVKGLHLESTCWQPCAISLKQLIHQERRGSKTKFVIAKALVDLDSPAFNYFRKHRQTWSDQDCFRFVGPIQYAGPVSIRGKGPITLHLNAGCYEANCL